MLASRSATRRMGVVRPTSTAGAAARGGEGSGMDVTPVLVVDGASGACAVLRRYLHVSQTATPLPTRRNMPRRSPPSTARAAVRLLLALSVATVAARSTAAQTRSASGAIS